MQVKRSRILSAGNFSQGMTFPFAAVGDHNPFTLALLTSWSPEDVPARLAELSISDFVRRFARGEEGAVFASIDQMDDLVLGPQHGARAKWRQEFLAELTQAMRDHPRLHLLLVTRGEALRWFITKSVGGGARHEITGLTRQAAVAAVVEARRGSGPPLHGRGGG